MHTIFDRVGQLADFLRADMSASSSSTNAQGVQHRCDTRRGNLRVMGEHGSDRVPAHPWTRHVMALKVVRVQFNESQE